MDFKCPYCGQSRLKHLRSCPKVYSVIRKKQFNEKAKQDYFGESPNIFVGRFGYPDVNVGFLANEELPKDVDAPRTWAKEGYKIPQVIDKRSALVNSRFKANVKSFDDKFLDMAKEVSMARKPVDVEINLKKRPKFELNYNADVTAYGPAVPLKKADITENPSIPTQVDKVVSDGDLKAVDAINYLYKKGYDEQYLTKLLTVGNLGIEKNRKLVPTRWGITATDDTLGKKLSKKIIDYPQSDHVAHFGGYLGNYYLILIFPDIWGFELFETVASTGEFATDHEKFKGRKDYAKNTVGGYYASRLAVLEHMTSIKRQGTVICLRFITDEYWLPLGVWVVREATRNAMKSKGITFSDKDLMLIYAKSLIKKKFSFDLNTLLSKSVMLTELKRQKKLFEF